jgi:hypothetical protein
MIILLLYVQEQRVHGRQGGEFRGASTDIQCGGHARQAKPSSANFYLDNQSMMHSLICTAHFTWIKRQ